MSSRIVLADFESDVKTLKRSSKLMRNRDYNSLVQVIEKFHRDVKLSSLTIKDRTQLIHLGEDAQFYRILVRMLHEITVSTGSKQREDLKKVVQWYQTNKEVLHGHPHFKGATKELYKRPSLAFSKDAIKHYSQPIQRRSRKKVSMATEPRSKSAVVSRSRPREASRQEGAVHGEGGTVTGARPLTAPPGLHRPKITNGFSSGHGSPKPILEENSFMVNYVNSKLAAYDNYEPILPRPSSAIGVTKPEILSSEDNGSSRGDPVSPIHTPNTSLDSFSDHQQDLPPATDLRDSQDNLSIIDIEHLFDTSGGKVELDERGLPKVVYPLPSLISPFAQDEIIEEESYHGGQPSDRRNKSPLKLTVNVNVPGNVPPSDMSEDETRSVNLQKWEEFQARQAFEQELASKQAFFGRGGDPMGVRYIGHDGGEMPEWYTQDVIANYAEDTGIVHQQVKTGEAFQSHPLEEFYQATEMYSPPVRPTSRISPRDDTTPTPPASINMSTEKFEGTAGRGYLPDEMVDNFNGPMSEQTRENSQSVHFESVVDLAGPVSDAMTMNKEMISPEPQLGYRQPALAITVKPPAIVHILERVDEGDTSPPAMEPISPPASQSIYRMDQDDRPSAVAPPNSSIFSGSSVTSGDYVQRNKRGEPVLQLPEESEYTVHFKRRQRPVTAATIPHAISSRQAARNQSIQKNKWGIEAPNEEELDRIERTKSAPIRRSLRSAGSTHGGRRPRTAIDVSMKQRWNLPHENDGNNRIPQAASHVATSMPSKQLSSLMVVSHLGGDNRRARSRIGYRGLKGYDENLPGFLPDMQFLSITGPAPVQGRAGQGDSILEMEEDHLSSNGSRTPSDMASTHPQLDNNLPSQQWNGLSVSTENPEQLSDPFSNKGGSDSLAGGDASERSSLLSGGESDRMNDLDDMDSPRPDDDMNDTPRTMDADLGSDLEAAENDTPRSTNADLGQGKDEGALRTIDIDMRSVSHINTEHEDNQSAIDSLICEQELTGQLIDTKDQNIDNAQCINTKDPNFETKDQLFDTKDNKEQYIGDKDKFHETSDQIQADYVSETIEETKNDQNLHEGETTGVVPVSQDNDEQTAPVMKELQSSDEGTSKSMESSADNNENERLSRNGDSDPYEIPSEKDILTGTEKADLLSRSFLAVTRNRRVERPSSAHPSLCPTHRLMSERLYHDQEKGRSDSPASSSSGVVYTKGLKSESMESIRSLPVGLTYMSLTDEHRTQLEKTVPLLDTAGFPMMPSVTKKHLTPRSSPNTSPRSTPVSSIHGSPRESRESFRNSPFGSRDTSPNSLTVKNHLDNLVNSNHGDSTSDSDADSTRHFRPIAADDEMESTRKVQSPLQVPPNILVRRPTSAPIIKSPRQDENEAEEITSGGASQTLSSRPTSARHRNVSPHPPSISRPMSARSCRGLSPDPGASSPRSPRSLSPRPTNARRPRSASPSPRSPSPRSTSVSPRPLSAKELRVSSPPVRPLSPRNRTTPEWKGRPLSVYGVKDPHVEEEERRRQDEAKNSVSIQSLFGKTAAKSHKKEMNKQEKERLGKKRKEELERMRNYNEHMWRRDMALIRHKGPIDKDWERDYMMDKLFKKRMREEKWTALKKQQAMENRRAQGYIKRIGPTVDIWDMFHGEKRGVTRMEFKKAAIILQKYIKGWIVRTMLKRVIHKSRVHARSFKSFMQYYNTVLKRIATWHGTRKPRIHADLWEIDEFMDRKRYYESVFVNRTHPGDEMEYKDLELFFKECDHFPSKREIYNAVLGATKKDPDKPHLKLREKDVVETAFMIYVPQGTGLKTEKLRKSTWMNPLVQGEEARKLMGSEDVEATSYLTSIQVVAAAFNERKERELEEIKRQAKKSQEAAIKAAQHQA